MADALLDLNYMADALLDLRTVADALLDLRTVADAFLDLRYMASSSPVPDPGIRLVSRSIPQIQSDQEKTLLEHS